MIISYKTYESLTPMLTNKKVRPLDARSACGGILIGQADSIIR